MTYNHGFYLDEFMERGLVRVFELLANVEHVDFTAGHHDTDQSSVVCAKALHSARERLSSHAVLPLLL